MAILFKKLKQGGSILPKKLQTGGEVKTDISKTKKINPYIRTAGSHNLESEDYVTKVMGDQYTPKNVGYTYGHQRDNAFTKAYNESQRTQGADYRFAGEDSTPMFTMYPGSSYRPGAQHGIVGQNYYLPKDTPGRVVTVGDYRANPSAYKYATQSADYDQYNKYLGL